MSENLIRTTFPFLLFLVQLLLYWTCKIHDTMSTAKYVLLINFVINNKIWIIPRNIPFHFHFHFHHHFRATNLSYLYFVLYITFCDCRCRGRFSWRIYLCRNPRASSSYSSSTSSSSPIIIASILRYCHFVYCYYTISMSST